MLYKTSKNFHLLRTSYYLAEVNDVMIILPACVRYIYEGYRPLFIIQCSNSNQWFNYWWMDGCRTEFGWVAGWLATHIVRVCRNKTDEQHNGRTACFYVVEFLVMPAADIPSLNDWKQLKTVQGGLARTNLYPDFCMVLGHLYHPLDLE